jgi:hypothetical protein
MHWYKQEYYQGITGGKRDSWADKRNSSWLWYVSGDSLTQTQYLGDEMIAEGKE